MLPPTHLGPILAAPADDGLRRALAAELREDGEPFGDWLEVQLDLAELPVWHPHVPGLREAEKGLWTQRGPEWTFGAERLSLGFQRGLPNRVEGTPAALIEELPRLLERAPIDTLALDLDEEACPDPHLEELAGVAALGRIRHLRLYESIVDPERLATLLSAPVWANLRVLELGIGACETEVVQALARRPLPLTLSELRCEGHISGMGDGGCLALAQAPWLPRLRRLDLRGQGLTNAALTHLAAAPGAMALEHLDLTSTGYATNEITAAGLGRLVRRHWFAGLRSLGLHGCPVAAVVPKALAQATHLQRVNLGRTGMDPDQVQFIGGMRVWHHLEELTLSGNELGARGTQVLSERWRLPDVLALRGCGFEDEALGWLGAAQPACALDLRDNAISAAAWVEARRENRLPDATTLGVHVDGWSQDQVDELTRDYARLDLSGRVSSRS